MFRLFERVKQYAYKAETALHKFFNVLRTVDACKIEYKIYFFTVFIEQCGICIAIVFKYLIYRRFGAFCPAVPDFFQGYAKGFSQPIPLHL